MIAIPHRVLRSIPYIEPERLRSAHKWCLHIAEGCGLYIEAVEHVFWPVRLVFCAALLLLAVGLLIWREV